MHKYMYIYNDSILCACSKNPKKTSLAEFHSGAAAAPPFRRAAAPQAMKFAPAKTHKQF